MFRNAIGLRLRKLAACLLTEIERSPLGCYAVGEYHAPHAEQQRQPSMKEESTMITTQAPTKTLVKPAKTDAIIAFVPVESARR
jgi:hypothetical protein